MTCRDNCPNCRSQDPMQPLGFSYPCLGKTSLVFLSDNILSFRDHLPSDVPSIPYCSYRRYHEHHNPTQQLDTHAISPDRLQVQHSGGSNDRLSTSHSFILRLTTSRSRANPRLSQPLSSHPHCSTSCLTRYSVAQPVSLSTSLSILSTSAMPTISRLCASQWATMAP